MKERKEQLEAEERENKKAEFIRKALEAKERHAKSRCGGEASGGNASIGWKNQYRRNWCSRRATQLIFPPNENHLRSCQTRSCLQLANGFQRGGNGRGVS